MITWPALIPSRSKISLTSNSFNSSSFNGCWGSSPKGTFTTSALPILQGFLLFEFWGCQLVFLGCLGGGPIYKYWNGLDMLKVFDSCSKSWQLSKCFLRWLLYSFARARWFAKCTNTFFLKKIFLYPSFCDSWVILSHDFADSNKVRKRSTSSISTLSSFHFSFN